MPKVDQYIEITRLSRDSHSIRDISRLNRPLTHHRPQGAPRRARSADEADAPPVHPRPVQGLKDRFESHGLSAVRLIEEIRPMGYGGSIDTVRRYLSTLRGEHRRRANLTVRFETPPGRRAQADWSSCGKHAGSDGTPVPVYAFVMVLSFSRTMFIRFTTSMKIAALIECHREAFAFFGGVPGEILYDNMKQVRIGPDQLNEQTRGLRASPRLRHPDAPAVPPVDQGQGGATGGLREGQFPRRTRVRRHRRVERPRPTLARTDGACSRDDQGATG